MSAISGYINQIQNAVYGEQVRTAIVNALEACYSDVENPDLQSEAFQTAIENAYEDGFLDITTVTSFNDMTNQNIIYRYNGTAAGKQKGLYYYSALSSSWVLIGSEIQKVSLLSQMTDVNDIYKYIGTESGMVQNSLYCHNGTSWVPIGSGILTASTAAQMTNTDAIYKYTGNETGYITNALYYYNGTEWTQIVSGSLDEVLLNAALKAETDLLTEADGWEDGVAYYENGSTYTRTDNSMKVIKIAAPVQLSATLKTVVPASLRVVYFDIANVAIGSEVIASSGTHTLTIPIGTATVKIPCKTTNKSDFSVLVDGTGALVGLRDMIPQITEDGILQNQSYFTKEDGYQIVCDSNSANVSKGTYTGRTLFYLSIPEKSTIKLSGYAPTGYNSGTSAWAVTNRFGYTLAFGQLAAERDEDGVVTIVAPESATTLIFTGTTTAQPQVYVKEEPTSGYQHWSPQIKSLTDLFTNVICIGDSVTQNEYPARLAEISGWTVTNAGKSGYTTIKWYEEEISKYNFANFDLAIIELGLNGGLTDTLATDVDPYESYEDYADTNTGDYCKIIETIKSQNPNAIIVMVHSPAIWSAYFGHEKLTPPLEAIANKYNLPLVNLLTSRFSIANSVNFRDAASVFGGIHPNKAGCYIKAECILNAINYELAQRPDLITTALS